jgi:hypothetical protein
LCFFVVREVASDGRKNEEREKQMKKNPKKVFESFFEPKRIESFVSEVMKGTRAVASV